MTKKQIKNRIDQIDLMMLYTDRARRESGSKEMADQLKKLGIERRDLTHTLGELIASSKKK